MEEQVVRSVVICRFCECEMRNNGIPGTPVYSPKVNISLDVCLACIQEEYSKIKPKI